MLVLSRRPQEKIIIEHELGCVEVVVLEIRGGRVKLGLAAPRKVVIERIRERIRK